MSKDSQNQPEDIGRQGMSDRYQGRHGGLEYEEEEDATLACVCIDSGSGPDELTAQSRYQAKNED
jgi:hypothetical protein